MLRLLLLVLLPITSIAQKLDYRNHQSPVKNQVGRGTCTAFSILAAMETLPGFPNDLSEQYVYAQAKANHYKEFDKYEEGAFLKFYIDVLQVDGVVREDQEPYNPKKAVWDESLTSFEQMKKDIAGTKLIDLLKIQDFIYKLNPNMYQYRSGLDARNVEWIKQQLDKGIVCIPVSYDVNGKYWFNHKGDANKKMTPNDFVTVKDGDKSFSYNQAKILYNDLANKILKDELKGIVHPNFLTNEGHAVAIVGYDETGFMIKNSWGTEWGNKGYGWISFDYHRLFCGEVMTLISGKVKGEEFKVPETVNKNDFWLKTLPYTYEGNKALKMPKQEGVNLSITFHGNGRMPRLKEIEYKIYDGNNNLVETVYGKTNGIFDGREDGYNTYALMGKTFLSLSGYKIIASFTTSSGQKFTSTFKGVHRKNQELRPG